MADDLIVLDKQGERKNVCVRSHSLGGYLSTFAWLIEANDGSVPGTGEPQITSIVVYTLLIFWTGYYFTFVLHGLSLRRT